MNNLMFRRNENVMGLVRVVFVMLNLHNMYTTKQTHPRKLICTMHLHSLQIKERRGWVSRLGPQVQYSTCCSPQKQT